MANNYSQEIAQMEISDSIAEIGMEGLAVWAEFEDWLKESEPNPCSMSDEELESFRTVATPEEMNSFLFG